MGADNTFGEECFETEIIKTSNMNIDKTKLNGLCKEVFEANKLKGFDVSKENIGQTLMLVVSELSEALEADRRGERERLSKTALMNLAGQDDKMFTELFKVHIKDSFEDEIADAVIRLFDLCGGLNIDLDWHVQQKRRYNALRPHKHGKAY